MHGNSNIKFITVFTRSRHSVGQMNEVTTTHPTSLIFILIIPSHQSLRFVSGFWPFGFLTKIRQFQNFLFLSHDHLFHVPQNSFNAWSSKALEAANIKEFQVNWKCPLCTAVCTHQHAVPRCARSTHYQGVLYFQNVIRFHATRASILPFTSIKYHTFFYATQTLNSAPRGVLFWITPKSDNNCGK